MAETATSPDTEQKLQKGVQNQKNMTVAFKHYSAKQTHIVRSGRASHSEASEIGGDKHINKMEIYHNSNFPLLILITKANKMHHFSTLFW